MDAAALGLALPDHSGPSKRTTSHAITVTRKLTDWPAKPFSRFGDGCRIARIVIVADSSFAALDLIAAVRRHVCLVTRLRLDANLFTPAT